MTELTFEDDSAAGRYRALLEGEEAGFVDYDPIGADGVLLKHTEVHRRYEGRGFGSRLVASMLDDARRRGKAVVPVCPYAIAFLRRHPEYRDVVREDLRRTL
jgi:predicted GNAT family acetyltransferase